MQRYHFLCKSWQGLLQQTVAQLGFGYSYYHIVKYPEKKRYKWLQIDKKLINKYQTKKSKFQRSRIKAKGYCNFYFLRWENIAIIFHTKGQISNNIKYDDKFKNINEKPMFLEISNRITMKVQRNPSNKNTISVFIERESYKNIKEQIYQIAARTKNKKSVIEQFKKLNGLPVYSGVYMQKLELSRALIKFCHKHNVKIHQKEIPIHSKRNIIEVFDKTIYL